MSADDAAKVSVLIPAYNEAERIGGVLQVVTGHPDVAEVLVIDDASQDGTADRAAAFPGVMVIRQPENAGKTKALAAGLHTATSEFVALIDADLIGLTPQDLTRLIAPVKEGRACVSISLRGNAPAPWRWLGLDYISGERVMPRALLQPVLAALERLPRFGFEVHLNRMILRQHLPIAVVPWPDVASPLKTKKVGLWAGIRGDLGMIRDMIWTVPPVELLRQVIGLRRLRV